MKVVIEGAGEVGTHLAKMLCNEAHDVTVIDSDQSRLDRLKNNANVMICVGKPSSITSLKNAGVENADLFISVNPSTAQDVNIVSALIAKKLGAKKVTARIDDEELLMPENKLMLKELGIELLFYPERLAANEIVDLIKHTATSESMDFANSKVQMIVFKLDEESPLLEMDIKSFGIWSSKNNTRLRVVAITNGKNTLMPKPDYRFRHRDTVFVMIRREDIDTVLGFLGKIHIDVKKVMILGSTPTVEIVARRLYNQQISDIKIIDNDAAKCAELSAKLASNINVVHGDSRNADFLLEENIRDYDAFLALTGNDEFNVLACVTAKKFGVERTIAEVENIEYIHLAEEMGIDSVINKKLITAGKIFKFTLSGKARIVKYMSGTDAEIMEYIVAKDSPITKAPLKDIDFPEDAIIGGVFRGKDAFIAEGNTQIEAFDKVAVFALPSAVKNVDKLFK